MGRRIDAIARTAFILFAVAAAARGAAAADFATDTADATIASLHQGLVELAARQPSASVEERYRALAPLIEATHDLPYIAEFALRRQWPMLSAADRERFVAAFERLSVTTYASRFKNVTAATFKATGGAAAADNGRMQVTTAIARPNAAEVSLEYLLQQRDGAWKIINIVADGVSDLALKRAEYQRILSAGSIDDLIKELDAQTARLK
jgi:phospholipid transport system substrate-binding protein